MNEKIGLFYVYHQAVWPAHYYVSLDSSGNTIMFVDHVWEQPLNRLHGHVVTQDEKDYCYRDCQIVMEVLKTFKNDKAFWSSVSASSYACTDLINGTYKQRMQYIEKRIRRK